MEGICETVHGRMEGFEHHQRSFIEVTSPEILGNRRYLNPTSYSIMLTLLQLDEVGLHPITRLAALLSLVCAFWSLLFGVLYIGRFYSLRGVEKGMNWIFVSGSRPSPFRS